MRANNHKNGLTLVEILIVVGIIAVLTSMVIGIARRVDDQGKERLVEDAFAILTAALSQFGDYGYNYNAPYSDLKFPLDCNDYFFSDPLNWGIKETLEVALGATNVLPVSGVHDPNCSGTEMLHFFLSRVPECRKTLEKIDGSLLVSGGVTVSIDRRDFVLLRFIDPWEQALRYDYYVETPFDPSTRRTFPVITSAGPDKRFGTDDDISSK
jgi:prepilin-type N-terminal cleavage/methylation domain-containing protein